MQKGPEPVPVAAVTEPAAGPTVDFPPQRVLLLVIPGFLAVEVLTVRTAQLVAQADPWPAAVLAGLVAVVVLVGAVLVQWMAVRGAFAGVRLEPEALVLPGRLRGRRRVPLAAVSGVGMQYVAGSRGSGWRPYVWLGDGRTLRLNIPPPQFPAPKSMRSWRRLGPGSAPPLDWNYLADSPAGRAQLLIAGRVLSVQGSTGLWRTEQREQRVIRPDTLHTAFWSPSGAIGVLDRPPRRR